MKMHSKIISILLVCFMMLSTMTSAAGNQSFSHDIGTKYVPLTEFCKKMGATYAYTSSNKKSFTISKDYLKLTFKVGSVEVKTSSGDMAYLEESPYFQKGVLMIPLEDTAKLLNAKVIRSQKYKSITIQPSDGILIPTIENTHQEEISRWAHFSFVQQFNYKSEGLAYAFANDNQLIIQTQNQRLTLNQLYPFVGDVLSDDEGNFYVVWGKPNETQNAAIETVFITKYSPQGQLVKTTGFVGESSPWKGEDSAKTQIPFDAGNCVSTIANGILVNYHGKQRYDGHQSDSVIAVNISDMSPYAFNNNTYSGHSFNQAVIYSKKTGDFLFASQGDAYPRGFHVNGSNGDYGEDSEVIFHFYLQAKADYDMSVVNETFAQLGNLVEMKDYVVFVGASAKAIGEKAKTQKQNLFIQRFNPLVRDKGNKFFGGETRSGEMSFDINDKGQSSMASVTDYGVTWLTNYSDQNTIAPQAVEADGKLVILWSTEKDSFYMVLNEMGDIVKPVTSLKRMPLNSYERPLYHNGNIEWVALKSGVLKKYNFKLN